MIMLQIYENSSDKLLSIIKPWKMFITKNTFGLFGCFFFWRLVVNLDSTVQKWNAFSVPRIFIFLFENYVFTLLTHLRCSFQTQCDCGTSYNNFILVYSNNTVNVCLCAPLINFQQSNLNDSRKTIIVLVRKPQKVVCLCYKFEWKKNLKSIFPKIF